MKTALLLALLSVAALAAPARAFDTVVIDPGHGGSDRGGVPGLRTAEKHLTLSVASRLGAILRERGVRTVMTRRSDADVSLARRVAIANGRRRANALFVSIHFNAARRGGAGGVETFYCSHRAAPIAARIQSRLARVSGGENRGVKRRSLYVLRKTRAPAVLVECGFLTNRREAALCRNPAHQQALAEAIARAIAPTLEVARR